MPIAAAGSNNAVHVDAALPVTTSVQSAAAKYLLRVANCAETASADAAASSGGVKDRVPRCQAKINELMLTPLKREVGSIVVGPLAKVPRGRQMQVIVQITALYEKYVNSGASQNVRTILKDIATKFETGRAELIEWIALDPKLRDLPVVGLSDAEWETIERYVKSQDPASLYATYAQPTLNEAAVKLRLVIFRLPDSPEGRVTAGELDAMYEKVLFSAGKLKLEQSAAATGHECLIVNPDPSVSPPGHKGRKAQQQQAAFNAALYPQPEAVTVEENRAGPSRGSRTARSRSKPTEAAAIKGQSKKLEPTLQARQAEQAAKALYDVRVDKMLETIAEDCQEQQARYPHIKFAALDVDAQKEVRRQVYDYYEDYDLASAVYPRPEAAKTDVFLTRIPNGKDGKFIRDRWLRLQKNMEVNPRDFAGSPAIWLKRYYIPFKHINPDPVAAPLKAGGAANLSSFEVESVTKAQTNPLINQAVSAVEAPKPIATSSPVAAATVPITYGPVFSEQVGQGLPEIALKSLKKIEDNLRSGVTPVYSVDGQAVLDIKMGGETGRGSWRLYVQQSGTGETRGFQIEGIYDNHSKPRKAWGSVKTAKAQKTAVQNPSAVELAAFRTPYISSQATHHDGIYTIRDRQYVRITDQGDSLFRIQNMGEGRYRLCHADGSHSASNPTWLEAAGDGTFKRMAMGLKGGSADGNGSSSFSKRSTPAQIINEANKRYGDIRKKLQPLVDQSSSNKTVQTATRFDAYDKPLPSESDLTLFQPHPMHARARLQPTVRPGTALDQTLDNFAPQRSNGHQAIAQHDAEDFQRFTQQRNNSLLTGMPLPDETPADSARLLAPSVLALLGPSHWPQGQAFVLLVNQQWLIRYTREDATVTTEIAKQVMAGDIVIRLPERLASARVTNEVVVTVHERDLPEDSDKVTAREYTDYSVGVCTTSGQLPNLQRIPIAEDEPDGLYASIAIGIRIAGGTLGDDVHKYGVRSALLPSLGGLDNRDKKNHQHWAQVVRAAGEGLRNECYPRFNEQLNDPRLTEQAYARYLKDSVLFSYAEPMRLILANRLDSGLNQLFALDNGYTQVLDGLAERPELLARLLVYDRTAKGSFNDQLAKALHPGALRYTAHGRQFIDPQMQAFVERHLQTLASLQQGGHLPALRGGGALGALIKSLVPDSPLHESLRRLATPGEPSLPTEALQVRLRELAQHPVISEEQAMARWQAERTADPRLSEVWQQQWRDAIAKAGVNVEVVKAQHRLELARIAQVYDDPQVAAQSSIGDAERTVQLARKALSGRQADLQARTAALMSLASSGNTRHSSGFSSTTYASSAPGKLSEAAPPSISASPARPSAAPERANGVAPSGSLQRSRTRMALNEPAAVEQMKKMLNRQVVAEESETPALTPASTRPSPNAALSEQLAQLQPSRSATSVPSMANLAEQTSPADSAQRLLGATLTQRLTSHTSLVSMPAINEPPGSEHWSEQIARGSSLSSIPSSAVLPMIASSPRALAAAGFKEVGSHLELNVRASHGQHQNVTATLSMRPEVKQPLHMYLPKARTASLAPDPNGRGATMTSAPSLPELTEIDTQHKTGVGLTFTKSGRTMKVFAPVSSENPLKIAIPERPEAGQIEVRPRRAAIEED